MCYLLQKFNIFRGRKSNKNMKTTSSFCSSNKMKGKMVCYKQFKNFAWRYKMRTNNFRGGKINLRMKFRCEKSWFLWFFFLTRLTGAEISLAICGRENWGAGFFASRHNKAFITTNRIATNCKQWKIGCLEPIRFVFGTCHSNQFSPHENQKKIYCSLFVLLIRAKFEFSNSGIAREEYGIGYKR